MREQLENLITMADRSNMTLCLLPFTAGQHPGLDGAFSVLEFADPDDGRIVTVETMTSTLYIEKTRDIGIYRLAFDQIGSAGLAPEETAEVITTTARELGR
jgi:hypothetical protein